MAYRGVAADSASNPAALDRAIGRAAWRLLPLFAIAYGLSYIDRVNISFAEPTMSRDLGFSSTVYGTGAGLLFVTYAAAALPSNLILARVGPRLWLGGLMIAWGLLAAGMMFVRTPTQFFAMRLALGAAEGGFFPGVVWTLSLWFPAAWRGRSISRFYVAGPVATVVMGAVAGGLLQLDGVGGLSGWRWLFLLEGSPTVLIGLVMLALLPDAPDRARWLDAAQRRAIGESLASERASAPAAKTGSPAVPFADVRVWGVGACAFLVLGLAYAVTFSAPRLLQAGAHLTAGQSGWVVAAGGLLGVGAMLGAAASSDHRRERFGHLASCWFAAAAGAGLMAYARSGWPLVAGYLLFFAAHFGGQGVFWAAAQRFVAPAQASVAIALINTIGMSGSFLAPIAWGAARDLTGGYELGLRIVPLGLAAAAALALTLGRCERLTRTGSPDRP